MYHLYAIQEVWKVSTTAGLKKVKKGGSAQEGSGSTGTKESEGSSRTSASGAPSTSGSTHADTSLVSSYWTLVSYKGIFMYLFILVVVKCKISPFC